MTSRNKHRVASIVALVIGLATIVEGGIVLLGIETKPYPVLPWLLRYNFAMGVLSLVVGHGLWREKDWGVRLARVVLVFHGVVFLTVLGLYVLGKTVAVQSVGAMLFRTVVWIGIVVMIRRKENVNFKV